MNLIKLYIREVTRRLPEKMREDITLELESSLLDMLPEDFTDDDVYRVLDELGNPATLAAGYRDRPMHIIGPKFYDIYVSILKLVMGIVGIVVFITTLVEKLYLRNINEPLGVFSVTLFGEAIWGLIESGIHVFFWVTIIFIILERKIEPTINVPLNLSDTKWTATDLKNIPYIPVKKEISLLEASFTLFWTIVWATLYFNAANIIGVYQSTENHGLIFTIPIFNQSALFAFLVVLMIFLLLELIKAGYMLIVRQWTLILAISNTVIHIFGFCIMTAMLLHPDLIHAEFAQYMADIIEVAEIDVVQGIYWTKWSIIGIVFITSIIDIYQGFKKANIK